MKPGQTLIGTNGKQVLLYPLEVLQVNQPPRDSLSHCCQDSIDVSGTGFYRDPIYAPCDCHLVNFTDWAGGNARIYASDEEVNYATGVGYVWFEFGHDENPPTKTSFKQGELIAHTGVAGNVMGDHCHLTVGLGSYTEYVSAGYGCEFTSVCYYLTGQKLPQDMWFINDTPVRDSKGLPFKTYQGGTPGPGPGPVTKKGMPLWMMLRKL